MNKKSRILFYYPDNERGVSLSSVMNAFKQDGHEVFLLTHAAQGLLHDDVKKCGVETFSYSLTKKNAFVFYLKHILFLVRFVNKKKIDIVYSHIQRANIISVFAQYFCSSKFYFCRHHSDCAFIDNNRNEQLVDRIINKLGKHFIVPSKKVYLQMTEVEKVAKQKIRLIKYAYNFNDYPLPTQASVEEIKNLYKCKMLILKAARLIPEKRHLLLFKAINKLVQSGLDIKLLILSKGPEQENLMKFILDNKLEKNIFMLGYKTNILEYVAAADLVVHVSESEASSNFVKEVGYLKKPIVVCHDVGDFDDYLVNEKNALLVRKQCEESDLISLLEKYYGHTERLAELGTQLHFDVLEKFSIKNVIHDYDKLNNIDNGG